MTAPWSPDPALCGNGEDCPACALRRDQLREAGAWDQRVPCNFCGGTGRVGRAVAAIIAEAVERARARAEYWPAREAAWAAQTASGGAPLAAEKSPERFDG